MRLSFGSPLRTVDVPKDMQGEFEKAIEAAIDAKLAEIKARLAGRTHQLTGDLVSLNVWIDAIPAKAPKPLRFICIPVHGTIGHEVQDDDGVLEPGNTLPCKP